MTIKDYEQIQWFTNFLFWVLELTLIILVIQKKKQLGTLLFICFLASSLHWFIDTNVMLFQVLIKMPLPLRYSIQLFSVLIPHFLLNMILFHHYFHNKLVKKMILPLSIIGIVSFLVILYINQANGIYLTLYLPIVSYIIVLPLSIVGVFELNPKEKIYKWNLSPSFLFFSGILIQFLGNSPYDLFAPMLMKLDENLLSILLTIRLFIWVAFCLFIIAGLYQIGRERRN